MSVRASVLAVAAFAILLLAIPATASALEFSVNSTADEQDDDVGNMVCHTTPGNVCTLRAAVEEANSSEPKDLITFAPNFNGEPADTIALGGPLPITEPIAIVGGTCEPLQGIDGPCAGVSGPTSNFGLEVDGADESLISGLSVTGALAGIDVIDSSEEFKAVGNWLGVKLDGTAGANNTGLFLDPESDNAAIGEPGEGNVISGNNIEGLDLEGASDTTIEGNYFGVAPDGATQAANGKDIEITDSTAAPGFSATGNVVGGELTGAEAASAACDGACNVISGAASFGIDLKGNDALQNEAPASGSTTIQGNLIGPNAAGTGVVANFRVGILAGEADGVQIGGPTAEVANRINGGEAGIQAGPSAQDLEIEGNRIGLDAAGTGSEMTPSTEGIALKAEGATSGHEATIAGNRIAMAGGIGIEVEKNGPVGTTIADNVIGRGVGGQTLTAGSIGIRVFGSQGSGNGIERNVIERPHLIGILLESSNNNVIGNEVLGTEVESGIMIQKFGPQESSGNIIGGDTAAEENEISGSKINAIDIVDSVNTENQIRRNTGSGNLGLFIDLGHDGLGNQPSGPNAGIQAPKISTATPTEVGGSGALGNATIRVFEKATAQNGEIEGFLGEAKADPSGKWELKYGAPLAEGTEVGATQTGLEGTSELAQATTATPPPPPPAGGGGVGGGPAGGGKEKGKKNKNKGKAKGKKDKTPPQTTITKGPPGRTHKRTAKFKFVSNESGSTFQCKLDRKPFKTCRSPKKYKRLKPGKHVFKVRAIDPAGNVDPSPAVKRFKVLK